MVVRVKWFYHPEETKPGRRPTDGKVSTALLFNTRLNVTRTLIGYFFFYDLWKDRGMDGVSNFLLLLPYTKQITGDILYLIGWKSDANFLDQSQSVGGQFSTDCRKQPRITLGLF